jgi:endonuclease YncB( thermonuclease family)
MGNVCTCLQKSSPYETSTYENTPEYTFENIKAIVKIIRIVDGDTVDIAFLHPDSQQIYRHRVRLYGIDTPEKRPSKDNPNRDMEIAASKRATEALRQRLKENDDHVLALFHKKDKYGRELATFYHKDGSSINQWMITEGHAYAYDGGKKIAFEDRSHS